MNRAVGIDFTETSVRLLHDRGFSSIQLKSERTSKDTTDDIFKAHYFPLRDLNAGFDGFEIHVVGEELDYLRIQKQTHFYPFKKQVQPEAPTVSHKNSVESFVSMIMLDELEPSELRDYLQLRKSFPLAALHLKCRDFKEFALKAAPDRYFKLGQKQVALIHMGPSCFDLIVSE